MQTLDMQNPDDAATVDEVLKRGGYIAPIGEGAEWPWNPSAARPMIPRTKQHFARGFRVLAIIAFAATAIWAFGDKLHRQPSTDPLAPLGVAANAPTVSNPFAKFGGYEAPRESDNSYTVEGYQGRVFTVRINAVTYRAVCEDECGGLMLEVGKTVAWPEPAKDGETMAVFPDGEIFWGRWQMPPVGSGKPATALSRIAHLKILSARG